MYLFRCVNRWAAYAALGIRVHFQSALNVIRGACTHVMPVILTLPIILIAIAALTTHGSVLADEQRWRRSLGSQRYSQRSAPSSSTGAARVSRLDDVEEEEEEDEIQEDEDDNLNDSEDVSLLRS